MKDARKNHNYICAVGKFVNETCYMFDDINGCERCPHFSEKDIVEIIIEKCVKKEYTPKKAVEMIDVWRFDMKKVAMIVEAASLKAFLAAGGTEAEYKSWNNKRNKVCLNCSPKPFER